SGKRFHPTSPATRGPAGETARRNLRCLLQFDLGAGSLELSLDLLGIGLGNGFLYGLRSALDQVLGFLEAEAGDGAHFLDDVDLLGASVGQHHVKLGLLLGRSSSSGTSAADSSNRNRSGSRNAPLLFQELRELGRLEDGQARQVFNDLGEISHFL